MIKDARLSTEQIRMLKGNGELFSNWVNAGDAKKDIEDHREHERYFKGSLSPENLDKMTVDEFAELWKKSWASRMWVNKEWYVRNKIVEPNGIEKIKDELKLLLYGSKDFVDRYNNFRENVAGFGVAIISEFLNMIFPDRFCLWNDKPRTVLPFLGLNGLPDNLYRYNTATGDEYLRCLHYLDQIKNELSEFGVKDFIDLDVFFWHIFNDVIPNQDKKLMQPNEEISKHTISNPTIDLEDLINSFDKDRNFFGKYISEKDAMDLQSQFIYDFPLDKILGMQIDDYCVGKSDPSTGEPNRRTFCYRLERKMKGFGGIGGTPSSKFGIYYDKETQDYFYDQSKHDSPEAAFTSIKSEIHFILQAGKQFSVDHDWTNLVNVLEGKFDIHRHVRSKILAVYYPNDFLQMHSDKDAERILKSLFGLPKDQIPNGLFLKQAKLLELKNSHPLMKSWSNYDYSTFIWYSVPHKDDNTETSRYTDEESVWLVRAGSGGNREDIALKENVIGIGYGGFDTSDSIKDITTFRQHFVTLHPDKKTGTVNREVPQIWNFLHKMRKDDFVILPLLADNSQTIAVGRIEGDYQDSKLDNGLTALRPVKWLKKDVPKAAFDDEIAKSLGYRGTIYRIGGSEMSNKLKLILRNLGASEIKVGEDQQMDSKTSQMDIRTPLTIDHLERTTYIPRELLEEIETLLIEKNQIIFYGPPGTSKTFVARKFSEYFTQDTNNLEIIQFHPSYSYEDFVEGIKPVISKNGTSGFSKEPGLIKKLAKRCMENPEKRFVLIIDEINRGNISKIFGELIYLLEYRNEKISLTYSPDERFSIPGNLYIIGTMNSADRSIAFVDYALRRRFYFIEFYPDLKNGILLKWFTDNSGQGIDPRAIVDTLDRINQKISTQLGREYQIGYSYFMVKDITINKLKMIFKYAVIPLIEQYYFGKKKDLKEIMDICNPILYTQQSNVPGQSLENQ